MAFYIRSAGSFELLTDVEGGAQQDRLVGGSQLLSTRIADELGERVVLDAPVSAIATDANGVVATSRAATVRAKRAVVALPPPLAGAIAYSPQLPPQRAQLGQRMAMGWLVKVTAVYDEPFWRADDLSGEALNEEGPVTMTFDNSPPGGTPGALVGFVGGADARRFARLGKSERRRAALGCFAALFGDRALGAERYLEQDWAAEPWSGGGPVANFATGGWSAAGPVLRRAGGSGPLGRDRDGDPLVRLPGRCGELGRARRSRGHRRSLSTTVFWLA